MSVPGSRTAYDWRAFSIAGIPVTFSAWFLLLVWVCLARAGSIEAGFISLIAVTVSVLVHELGHAWVAKRYGLRPAILLHAWGGWCEHEAAHYRDDALKISAAGPGAGLVLGGLALVPHLLLRDPPWWLAALLGNLVWMGLFWSLVNLLPILPLDGGSILENLLERRRSITSPLRLARIVGVVASFLVAAVCVWFGEWSVVILVALLAWNNAGALGWLPAIPGMTMVRPADRSAAAGPQRAWWRPGPAVATVLLILGLPVLANAVVDVVAALDGLALHAGAARPWQVLTWPLVPSGRAMALLSALVAVWLLGPALERRRGKAGAFGLAAAVVGLAGLAAAAVGVFLPGTLAGPIPVALAFAAAWAWLSRGTTAGPSAIPVGPPLLVAFVVVADLADKAWTQDAVGAVADVVAVALGLVVAAVDTRGPMQRLELWWKLRNPPKIDIRLNRPPD